MEHSIQDGSMQVGTSNTYAGLMLEDLTWRYQQITNDAHLIIATSNDEDIKVLKFGHIILAQI